MTLREKLMHYTYGLDCDSDLKQEAITTIETIAQYMDEDELLHHSRPLALAYLALTEDTSASVVRGKCPVCSGRKDLFQDCYDGYSIEVDAEQEEMSIWQGDACLAVISINYCPNCGAKMDGGFENG